MLSVLHMKTISNSTSYAPRNEFNSSWDLKTSFLKKRTVGLLGRKDGYIWAFRKCVSFTFNKVHVVRVIIIGMMVLRIHLCCGYVTRQCFQRYGVVSSNSSMNPWSYYSASSLRSAILAVSSYTHEYLLISTIWIQGYCFSNKWMGKLFSHQRVPSSTFQPSISKWIWESFSICSQYYPSLCSSWLACVNIEHVLKVKGTIKQPKQLIT